MCSMKCFLVEVENTHVERVQDVLADELFEFESFEEVGEGTI